MDKQTDLKGQHNCVVLFYFICGKPCQLPSFKQWSGTSLSSENSLFIHLWKKYIFLSLYYYFINIVNIKREFEFLLQKLHSAPFIKFDFWVHFTQ